MNASFNLFASEVGTQSPYKDLRKTRAGYHSKWMLLKTHKPQSIRRSGGYFVLQSSCVPKDVQHKMIMSKSAVPVPPKYEQILECMETWGNGISHFWAQEVYHYLQENMHYELELKDVVADCIWFHMKEKIGSLYSYSTEATYNLKTLLLNEWLDYFHATYGIVSKLPFPGISTKSEDLHAGQEGVKLAMTRCGTQHATSFT